MKKFFFSALFVVASLPVSAQKSAQLPPADKNVGIFITDTDYYKSGTLIVGDNNVMIGDLICFDLNKEPIGATFIYPNNEESFVIRDINEKHDSLVVGPYKYGDVLKVGDATYNRVLRYVYKDVEWIPLTQVAKAYGHEVKGDVLYMINDRIISRGAPGFKLQKDFILRVEVESSKDMPTLSKKNDFSIVRVYTKTARYAEIAKDGRIH